MMMINKNKKQIALIHSVNTHTQIDGKTTTHTHYNTTLYIHVPYIQLSEKD